jgi:hypothetical protein
MAKTSVQISLTHQTKKSQPDKDWDFKYGGGWLTTEQLSICAQEGIVGNERR